jgi:hypothetical protein
LSKITVLLSSEIAVHNKFFRVLSLEKRLTLSNERYFDPNSTLRNEALTVIYGTVEQNRQ